MRRLMVGSWGQSVECRAHRSAYLQGLGFVLLSDLDLQVSGFSVREQAKQSARNPHICLVAPPCDKRGKARDAANAPCVAGLVSIMSRYRAPYFGAIIAVSHCAVPSRCGQGRAVLVAPWRPDFLAQTVGVAYK
jgi:hypothetical protein